MKSKEQFLGMAAALAANIIFGFSFVFSKLALSVAHPLVILAVRFTVAFILMNIFWVAGLLKLEFKNKPKGKLFGMAIAQPLLYFILELYGLKMVSSALSGIIIALVPVGVLIISALFLREKANKSQVAFTILSIAGISAISILSNDGEKNYLLGIILLVGAVIAAAVFNILSRKEAENYSPFERTYAMFLIATVGFNVIALSVLKGDYFTEIASAFKSGNFIIAILYLAVLSSVAAFMLYNYSTSKISAVRSSSFSNIITVVSVLGGVIILKEDFSVFELLLCIPVIFGVWGVNFQKEKL